MKKFSVFLIILLSISSLFAQKQKDTAFYRHEVKVSVSDALLADIFWNYDYLGRNPTLYAKLTFSYSYRPLRWFWIGGNFVNYFGGKIEYKWKEYATDGSVKSFSKSKIKYLAAIAPEIRFSYLNRRHIVLYSALSAGICIEDGYENKNDKYPELHFFFHTTLLGISSNFGKKDNIFLGCEFGLGFKGFLNIQGGYRF